MKIVGILDNGTQIELAELKCLDGECDILLAKMNIFLSKADTERFENELTEKIGKKVVCIPPHITELLALKK